MLVFVFVFVFVLVLGLMLLLVLGLMGGSSKNEEVGAVGTEFAFVFCFDGYSCFDDVYTGFPTSLLTGSFFNGSTFVG